MGVSEWFCTLHFGSVILKTILIKIDPERSYVVYFDQKPIFVIWTQIKTDLGHGSILVSTFQPEKGFMVDDQLF